MRISRKKKKVELKRLYQYNERISAPRVILLDFEGKMMGEMNTAEAISKAMAEQLDLVVINPKNDPPVAKMTDFGQFKYQKEKEERKKKAKQHITDTKGIRLSLRIGTHDLEIRRKQTLKFLDSGDKVKIEIILRGRENRQTALAFEIMQKFIDSINEEFEIRVEQKIERQGNKVTCLVTKQ